MREPLPRLSKGPSRNSSSSAPDHQLRNRRRGLRPLAIRATRYVFSPANPSFSPFLPLATSIVLLSVESGTEWPSTKLSATSARKKGHGLSGETAIGPDCRSLEPVPAQSSCMDLNPQKAQNYRAEL